MKRYFSRRTLEVGIPVFLGLTLVVVSVVGILTTSVSGTIAAGWAAIVYDYFVYRYLRTSWRRTSTGRTLMLFMLLLAVVFDYIIAASFFGNFISREWLRLVIYLTAALVGTRFGFILLEAQEEGEKVDDNHS